MRGALSVLCLLLCLAAAPGVRAEDGEETEIRRTVDGYAAALAEGNLERLRAAFVPDGAFVRLARQPDGTSRTVTASFAEVLPAWTPRPFPGTRFTYTQIKVIEGRLALVEGVLDMGDIRFADLLNLYKVDGRWLIAAKTTTTLPKP